MSKFLFSIVFEYETGNKKNNVVKFVRSLVVESDKKIRKWNFKKLLLSVFVFYYCVTSAMCMIEYIYMNKKDRIESVRNDL